MATEPDVHFYTPRAAWRVQVATRQNGGEHNDTGKPREFDHLSASLESGDVAWVQTPQTLLAQTRAPDLGAAFWALLLGATLSLGCGQVERPQASSTRAAPDGTGAVVVLRPTSAAPGGPDAPPRVTLAWSEQEGTLTPIAGQYLDAVRFRDGVAAVTLERELQVLHADGSRSLVAKDLDGLPALDGNGALVYAARFGEVVELYRLRNDGTQQRLASFRGSATRLSPRPDGTVVFIGSKLGDVSGIWVADSQGARCLTNCDLRVGRARGHAYRALPGETDTVRFVGSRTEWVTAEGRSEFAPVTPAPSLPAGVTP